MADEELDPERLTEITNQMVEAITSPPYVEAMRAVKAAEGSQRLEEAMERLTPDALRKQGVKLPEDMRISSRFFEAGFKPVELGEPIGTRNLLTELRVTDPEAFRRINKIRVINPHLHEELIHRLIPDERLSPVALCGCACGGAATVCGGAGGG